MTLPPDEVHRILSVLDTRTRRIENDTAFMRARLDRLSWKVAGLSGVVAALVAYLFR